MRVLTSISGGALACLAACALSAAHAQSPADFYQGKTVELYIGYSAGGGYDVYARALARHMGRHIAGNPTIVPKNMPGAGSLVLGNWLYNVAAKDGTVFGMIGRGVAFDPLLGSTKAQFDASRFKIITGYPGGNDIDLAMERGEVMGRCGWSWSSVIATHKHWLDERKISVLVQLSLSKHPDLPNVPLIMDFARNEEEKQIFKLVFARQPMGRPFLAPPGIPPDRAAALRKAFVETMRDAAFLAESQKMALEINPVSGEAVQAIVAEAYATPKPIAEKVANMVNR